MKRLTVLRVVDFLRAQPDREFTQRQVAEALQAPEGTVMLALCYLSRDRVVVSREASFVTAGGDDTYKLKVYRWFEPESEVPA